MKRYGFTSANNTLRKRLSCRSCDELYLEKLTTAPVATSQPRLLVLHKFRVQRLVQSVDNRSTHVPPRRRHLLSHTSNKFIKLYVAAGHQPWAIKNGAGEHERNRRLAVCVQLGNSKKVLDGTLKSYISSHRPIAAWYPNSCGVFIVPKKEAGEWRIIESFHNIIILQLASWLQHVKGQGKPSSILRRPTLLSRPTTNFLYPVT